jgi:hypothetical protein
VKYERRVEEM